MSFLTPNDFIGRFAIPQPFNGDAGKLQSYIDHYETEYLVKLLGAELHTLFLAGYANDEEIYVKLYDAFNFDSEAECKPMISYGMEQMLKGFIYVHFNNGDLETPTSAGNIRIEPEAGTKTIDETTLYRTYNEAIGTYKTIRAYILENDNDYPSFKGIYLGLTWVI